MAPRPPLPSDRRGTPPPPPRIPRPPTVEPGAPAPWSRVPPSERTAISLARARAALAHPFDVQRRPPAAGTPRQSAVLAPLFDEAGEARIVLTRRASTLRNHRSEVSFPGGRVDSGETLVQAALREAWEEVGIEPASVEVIGTLTPLTTYSSASLINPFVGVLPGRPTLRTNPAEVERAFDVPLSVLVADGVHRAERWGTRELHFFELPGDIIWGATGRLLWELLGRVTGTLDELRPEEGALP